MKQKQNKLHSLIFSKYLSDKHDCKIYLKPEWYGKTGSHKDKWANLAIKIAKNKDHKKVVTISSGNQGLAAAAEAKKNNMECVVISYSSIPHKYKPLFKKYKSKLILCPNEISISHTFNSFVKRGYFPLSLTLSQRKKKDTIGIDGYKETSKEIVRDLKKSPDIIIIPTCYGDFSEGILRGFKALKKKRKTIPKFILARAKIPEGKVAFSISTNVTTPYVRNVIKQTKGKSIFLNNNDFRKAQKLAKNKLNICLETAAAGAIASLSKIKKEDMKGKTIVLILTALEK